MKLIITADDYGYSKPRNDAINKLYKMNKISRSSLLVNGDVYTPTDCPLGLHLNLSEGKSLLNHNHLTKNGMFLGKMEVHNNSHLIPPTEIRSELIAQINKFVYLTGELPEYIDGHQHVHVLPSVIDILIKECSKRNIMQCRVPYEDTTNMKPFYKHVSSLAFNAIPKLKKAGFLITDYFFGLGTMGYNMTIDNVNKSLNRIDKNNVCEWMVHPGYPCASGGCGMPADDFSQSDARLYEYNFLISLNLLKQET